MGKRFVPITHRCDGRISPDGGYCEPEDRIDCPAFRRADGSIEKSELCGEPCSWIMGKSGYGNPPWQTIDGLRIDPAQPDPGYETAGERGPSPDRERDAANAIATPATPTPSLSERAR